MQKLFQNTINENFELDKKDILKLRGKVEQVVKNLIIYSFMIMDTYIKTFLQIRYSKI